MGPALAPSCIGPFILVMPSVGPCGHYPTLYSPWKFVGIWGVLFGKRFQRQAVWKIGFQIIKKKKPTATADKTERRTKERERWRWCICWGSGSGLPKFRCLATRSWYGRPKSQRGWTTGSQGLRVALVVGYCMVAAATNSSSNIAAVDAVCLVLLLVGSRLS
jgi:hypothetical protein